MTPVGERIVFQNLRTSRQIRGAGSYDMEKASSRIGGAVYAEIIFSSQIVHDVSILFNIDRAL